MPIQLDFTIRRLGRLAAAGPDAARPAAVQGGLRGRPALDGRGDGEALPRRRRRSRSADGRDHVGLRHRRRRGVRPPGAGLLRRRPRIRRSGAPTGRAATRRWWSCCATWRTNGFTTYIASGGDRDFMRPVAGDLYGIPPERVIGSALGLDYRERQRHADVAVQGRHGLLRRRSGEAGAHLEPHRPTADPVRRQLQRRRPDAGVLRPGAGRPALRLLLLHDDDEREFDYTAGAEEALDGRGRAGLDRRQHEGRLDDGVRRRRHERLVGCGP